MPEKTNSRSSLHDRNEKTAASTEPSNIDDLPDATLFPENNPFPVLRVAGNGALVYANPASGGLIKAWGCQKGELVPDFVRVAVENALASDKIVQFETAVDGTVYLIAAAPVAGQRAVQLYGVEITDWKRTQAALARANEQMEWAFDAAPGLAAVIDAQHRIVRVNRPMAKRLGLEPDACIGMICYRAVHGADEPPDYCPHSKTVADKQQHAAEIHEPHLGGNFEVSTTPIFDTEGRFAGSVHIARDITERKKSEAAARAAEERLRVTLTSIGDAVVSCDRAGNIVFLNPVAEALTGWPAAEAVGRPISEVFRIINEQTREPSEDIVRQVLDEGQVVALANHTALISRDGREIPIEDSAAPVRDAAGSISGVVVVFHDVTEKRRALQAQRVAVEALRAGEARFRSAFDESAVAMALVGVEDATFLRVNSALCGLLGRTPDELAGHPVAEFTHPDDVPKSLDGIARAASEKSHVRLEKRYFAADGRIVWGEVNSAPVLDEQGRVSHLVTQIVDLTARKAAEAALRESEERFRSAFDESAVAMAMTAPEDGALLRVNPAFCAMLGRAEDELLGRSVNEFTHPDDVAATVAALALASMQGRKFRLEKRYFKPDGSVVWGDLSSAPVRDEQGRVEYLVTHIADITARKIAENALREREGRFRDTLAAMMEGCQIIDFDWRYVFLNDAAVADVRRPKEEMLGHTIMDCCPGIENTELFTAARRCMEQREPAELETEFVYPDGDSAWFKFSIQPAPAGIFVFSLDVTARKKAEERTVAYLADLRALSSATARLMELTPDEDVYAAIAVGLESLCGDALILISSYDPEKCETTVRAVVGPLPARLAIVQTFGRDPVGLVLPATPDYRATMKDLMQPLPNGVFDLAFGRLPEPLCREIELRIGVAEVRAMPFRSDEDLLGLAAVAVVRGQSEISWDSVETFVRLAAIAVLRRRAIDQLREWNAALEEHVGKRTAELQNANVELSAANVKLTKSQVAVEYERQRFRRTLDNMLEGCMIIGRDWRYLYINDVAARSASKEREDIVGRKLQEVDPGVEESTTFANYRRTMEDRTPRRFEDSVSLPDGTTRWFERSVEPAPEGIFVLTQEISERKQADQELRRLANRLRALAGELALTEERERRRLAELMHDHLQQLLVAAKYNAAALSNRTADDIKAGVDRIGDLLGQSIDAARSLTAELQPPVLHESGLAAGLYWLARRMLERHGLRVEVDAPAAKLPLSEDQRPLIFRAASELLFNVAKHAGVDRARVNLQGDGRTVRLTVSDEGRGFDPNAVGDHAAFGLFSIRERLSLFGGALTVDSAPGRGTRVALSMPTAAPEMKAASRAAADSSSLDSDAPPAPIRVLIVDDHGIVRTGIAEILKKQPGLTVVGEASDGEEALEAARRLRPHVVLMDATMPGMNGIDATRAIVAEMPAVRVIGLSMHDGDDVRQRMRAAGASDYFVKDGPLEALIAAIRAVAAAPSAD